MKETREYSLISLDVETGGIRIVVMDDADAREQRIRAGDRVLVKPGGNSRSNKSVIAVLDTSKKRLKRGQVGVFAETKADLGLQARSKVTITKYGKPDATFHIQKKLHGAELTKDEFCEIIGAIVRNELTDIEMTYFVSACYAHELTINEITYLTEAIIETGNPLDFGKIYPNQPIVDKHCIGGVAGNRTTALVVPIIAAAGYIIPKTSSRSITSPAGTSDTLEVMANVSLTRSQIKNVIKKTKGCLVWGGSLDLAPADDKIIRVEHPISLDPIGQLIASILAKKKSVGSTHVLIDIPVGKGAKVQSRVRALALKRRFEQVGKKLGMHVLVVISDGSQPIGNGIGPALEARDILWTLQNDSRGSKKLYTKAIHLSGLLLEMVGHCKAGYGTHVAKKIVDSGQAAKTFSDMLIAQGLNTKSVNADEYKVGKHTYDVVSPVSGKIAHVDNKIISRIAKLLGAPFDQGAGIYLHAHKLQTVAKGQALYTLYTNDSSLLKRTKLYLKKEIGFDITEE